uniref:Uncharacterized protein n=1 Tax=Eutreptiella gymnastica TaxID=73025 RepID=A0A7S1IAY6_9EUGL
MMFHESIPFHSTLSLNLRWVALTISFLLYPVTHHFWFLSLSCNLQDTNARPSVAFSKNCSFAVPNFSTFQFFSFSYSWTTFSPFYREHFRWQVGNQSPSRCNRRFGHVGE